MQPRRRSRQRSTFSGGQRQRLVDGLSRHVDAVTVRGAVIPELEQVLEDYVTLPDDVPLADLEDSVRRVGRAAAELDNAIRRLPGWAGAVLRQHLLLDRKIASEFLGRVKEASRVLSIASAHVAAQLARKRKPGRPRNRRLRNLAVQADSHDAIGALGRARAMWWLLDALALKAVTIQPQRTDDREAFPRSKAAALEARQWIETLVLRDLDEALREAEQAVRDLAAGKAGAA